MCLAECLNIAGALLTATGRGFQAKYSRCFLPKERPEVVPTSTSTAAAAAQPAPLSPDTRSIRLFPRAWYVEAIAR